MSAGLAWLEVKRQGTIRLFTVHFCHFTGFLTPLEVIFSRSLETGPSFSLRTAPGVSGFTHSGPATADSSAAFTGTTSEDFTATGLGAVAWPGAPLVSNDPRKAAATQLRVRAATGCSSDALTERGDTRGVAALPLTTVSPEPSTAFPELTTPIGSEAMAWIISPLASTEQPVR